MRDLYRHKESGNEVVITNDNMVSLFVREGFEYVGEAPEPVKRGRPSAQEPTE